MNAIYKKLLRRGIIVLAAASVCAFGIHTAVTRSQENAPDVITASAGASLPVIVPDAAGAVSETIRPAAQCKVVGSSQ